jgi:peptidoglycan/xylan/chitin deacetylase (PgdA/CDA1 family)
MRSFALFVLPFLLLSISFTGGGFCLTKENSNGSGVPILLYHRFGPTIEDSMTVRTAVFEAQLRHLKDHSYTFVPLKSLVDYYMKEGPPLPERSVVISVDDGHRSVYTEMFPLLKKYRVPATLFLYPSALSNAGYAMTWEQLQELKTTGLFDFQSHTFWHPNFNIEKRRLKEREYEDFVKMQLKRSKERIEREFNSRVELLAWPFGIHDDELGRKAAEAGYVAAFTMERRHARPSDPLMKLPRYLMVHAEKHLLPF